MDLEIKLGFKEITQRDISGIGDFDEAFRYAKILDVDLGGLDDIEDMIERLSMHHRKLKKGYRNIKTQIESAMLLIRQEDERKRSTLQSILYETEETFGVFQNQNDGNATRDSGLERLKDLLKTEEGDNSDLALDFSSKIESIKSGEYMVVVLGETSAGKSTLVNLLLEEDILPMHTLNCTSLVAKISYCPKRRAKIIYNDSRQTPLTLEKLDRHDIFQQVLDAIGSRSDEQGQLISDVKEVQLFLPSKLLRSGLVFVYTPGIGENVLTDDAITRFIAVNEIMGFIYVIKSDNAGGVEEDRLLNLMRVILEKQREKTNLSLPFDPKSAIFLCNHWDDVKKDESDVVFQNDVRKLAECWPNLDSTQVIRISARKARAELQIDPDYITHDYQLCLEGIKNIFQKALDRRVKSTYKWIENILLRNTYHLKALVKRLDSSERSLAARMDDVTDKLHRLRQKSDDVIANMKTKTYEASQKIANEFREYLQSSTSNVAITSWAEEELPSKQNSTSWLDVKDEIDSTVSRRIEEQLENWEQATHTVKGLETHITMDMKVHLHLLQDDLEEVEKEMLENDDKNLPIEQDEFPNTYRDSRGRRKSFASLRYSSSDMGVSLNANIPIKLKTRVKNPVRKFLERMKKNVLSEDYILARRLKSYKSNPCKIAKERSEKLLHSLLNTMEGNAMLFSFVEELLEIPSRYIKTLEERIPALIQSNEELKNQILKCRGDTVQSRSLYENMMENMETLRRHLMEYGYGHIFVDDFMGNITIQEEQGRFGRTLKVSEIELSTSALKEENEKDLTLGIWTAMQNGSVNKDGRARNVSVRIYLPSVRLEHAFKEVAKLRCLENEHVAEFLGIYHSDSPAPAFVYDGHLKSFRIYKASAPNKLQFELPRIVIEIAQGIGYLHHKNLVHMELSIDTVTVTNTGIVKLSGGSLPRYAALPVDRETIEVGEFVYLAPEVLNGELYVACADIYSYALLLFELFVGCSFTNQRKWRLDHFSSKIDPMTMLDLEVNLVRFTEPMKYLIIQCLHINPDSRPSTDMVLQNMKKISEENSILRKTTDTKNRAC